MDKRLENIRLFFPAEVTGAYVGIQGLLASNGIEKTEYMGYMIFIALALAAVNAAIYWKFYNTVSPLWQIVLAVVVGLVIHAVMYGPQAAFVTEQFPTRVRYAGSSLAYTLAGILGGGFAPLIIVSLFKHYNSTLAVSVYVAIAVLVTGVSLIVARETARRPLEN